VRERSVQLRVWDMLGGTVDLGGWSGNGNCMWVRVGMDERRGAG